MPKHKQKGKVRKHTHIYESGFVSLAYAISGKGHIAMCSICHKEFNKATGELEKAF